MKICTNCGAQLLADAQFCTNCGAVVKTEEPIAAVIPESQMPHKPATPVTPEVTEIPETQVPMASAAPAVDVSPESQVPQEEKTPKKKASKKKVIAFVCVIVLLMGLAVAAYFWLSWYFSPEQKVLRLLADGKYDEALELVEDERSLRRSDDFEEGLMKRLNTLKDNFHQGKAEFSAVMEELEAIELMEVEKVNGKLPEYREFVVNLNASRTNFTAAERFFQDGAYPDAIALYKLVIQDDSNYETAKSRITEATNKYRQAALAEAKTYADGGAYSNAIAVLTAALEVLPEDSELTSQKLMYEKDHLNQIKAEALDEAASYAVSQDFETAMSVLDKYTAEYGADSEVSVKRNEYLEAFVDGVLAQVDKAQGEKNYTGALKALDDGLKVAKDHNRLKNRREAVAKAYAEDTCAEADTLVAAKKYDEALSLIDTALKTLPGNTTLTAKRTEIEDAMPKKLLNVCKPYETYEYEEYVNGRTFLMGGQEYTDGFEIEDDGYAIFNVNGAYDVLDFDLGHVDDTDMEESPVEIYLDGQLYKTIKVNAEDLPQHYSISVAGVRQVKIKVKDVYGNPCIGFGNIIVQ